MQSTVSIAHLVPLGAKGILALTGHLHQATSFDVVLTGKGRQGNSFCGPFICIYKIPGGETSPARPIRAKPLPGVLGKNGSERRRRALDRLFQVRRPSWRGEAGPGQPVGLQQPEHGAIGVGAADLSGGTDFVRQIDQHRLPAAGKPPQGKGPHMAGDDVLLHRVQRKTLPGIAPGRWRGGSIRGDCARRAFRASRTRRNHGAAPPARDCACPPAYGAAAADRAYIGHRPGNAAGRRSVRAAKIRSCGATSGERSRALARPLPGSRYPPTSIPLADLSFHPVVCFPV